MLLQIPIIVQSISGTVMHTMFNSRKSKGRRRKNYSRTAFESNKIYEPYVDIQES